VLKGVLGECLLGYRWNERPFQYFSRVPRDFLVGRQSFTNFHVWWDSLNLQRRVDSSYCKVSGGLTKG